MMSNILATLGGVGDPGPGRHWVQRGNEMVLIDNRRGVVARKSIPSLEQPEQPTDIQRPKVPIQSSDADRPLPQPLGDEPEIDLSSVEPPPDVLEKAVASPARPSLPIGPSEPRQPPQPQGDELVFDPVPPPQIQLPSDPEPRPAVGLEEPVELAPVPPPTFESDSLNAVMDSTLATIGDVQPPEDVIVTEESLLDQSGTNRQRQLFIDPNINEAWISEGGREVARFAVGTGDTTGTRFGKKYFSPTGTFKIVNEVPYGDVEGSYGPLWMGLDAPKSAGGSGYGLHGPHARADLAADSTGFVNQGFVSHGCLRFKEADMLRVGKLLDAGASVTILPYGAKSPTVAAR